MISELFNSVLSGALLFRWSNQGGRNGQGM